MSLIRGRNNFSRHPPCRKGTVARWLGVIAILPFALLSLLSAGNMLTHDPGRGVIVILCIDGAPVEMLMTADDLADKATPVQDHDGKNGPCQWAPHGQPLLQAAAPDISLPIRLELTPDLVSGVVFHARRAEVLTPAARGPPLILL